MSRLALFSFLLAISLFGVRAAKGDDLFSEISISSVYSQATEDDQSIERQKTGRRLTGGHSIQRLLADAGYIPTDLDDGVIAIDAEVPETERREVLITVNVSPDHEDILLSAAVVKVDPSKVTSSTLANLLRSRADKTETHYVFSQDWLRARRRLDNKHVSKTWIKSKIEALIDTISSDAATWQTLGKSFDKVIAENRQKNAVQNFDFSGTWTAIANGTRYGFKFDSANFKLGIVTGGNLTKSQGTWKVVDGKLQLNDSGIELKAQVEIVSKDEVKLKFDSQPELTFNRK